MMRSLSKGFAVAAIVVVSLGWAGYATAADPGHAADCQALKVAIDKEMTLMVKRSLIEKAMTACPGDIDIVYQHGYTLERLRKYKEALQSYKKAIALDPNYAKAYFSMGDVQMVLKNYREAAEAYLVGLRLDPADARAKDSLADARARYHDLTGKTLPAAPVPPQVAAASTCINL
jgi:tetratricopeptide (TPR) repeat protein